VHELENASILEDGGMGHGRSPEPIVIESLLAKATDASLKWDPFHPGVDIHVLYGDPTSAPCSALLRYEAGATLTRHWHVGWENILVLSGSQIDENGEHRAGALLIHAPGSSHVVRSPKGCIVLAWWERPVTVLEPETAEISSVAKINFKEDC
jgi:anti-sigma factor ChrR (cupin superfamily)